MRAAHGAELALVIADLDSGGAQKVACTLANAWAAQGRRVCVITLAGPQGDFFRLDAGVERRVVGTLGRSKGLVAGLLANLRRVRRLRRILRRLRPRVAVSFIAPTNVLLILAAAGLGLTVVVSERNDPARQSYGPAWDALRRLTYRFAQVVSANTQGALETLAAYVPRAKLALVPNPVPLAASDPADPAAARVVLSIGRLHRQKAHDVLLAAFARMADALPDWRLHIVGEGPLRADLEAQAARLRLGERVIWHGRAADPSPFYRAAGIFVMASRYEGLPNALLEAMSCGLPVVVSDASPGPLEWVEDGRSGLVVPAEDPDALAAALLRLGRDPGLRRRLGHEAKGRLAGRDLASVLRVWEETLGLEPRMAEAPRRRAAG